MSDSPTTGAHVLEACISVFESQRRLADRALAQVDPERLAESPGDDMNSVRILMKHLAGNMRSRWTDFLTTDGEKPDRHRDREFEDEAGDAEAVPERWKEGWETLFATLRALTPDDLLETVTIRGRPLTVLEAILKQVSHYAYHVGQIVLLARMQAGKQWTSLSIPRSETDAFHRERGDRS